MVPISTGIGEQLMTLRSYPNEHHRCGDMDDRWSGGLCSWRLMIIHLTVISRRYIASSSTKS
jgi:hypothetical protein